MLLDDKQGIACDYCGTQHRKEFSYYSVEVRQGRSQGGRTLPLDIIRRAPVQFEFDLCEDCEHSVAHTAVTNYRAVPVGVVCDLTGVWLNGDFVYYYVDITGVSVKVTRSGNAEVTTRPRHLELTISAAAYADVSHKVRERRKVDTGWRTTTQ